MGGRTGQPIVQQSHMSDGSRPLLNRGGGVSRWIKMERLCQSGWIKMERLCQSRWIKMERLCQSRWIKMERVLECQSRWIKIERLCQSRWIKIERVLGCQSGWADLHPGPGLPGSEAHRGVIAVVLQRPSPAAQHAVKPTAVGPKR